MCCDGAIYSRMKVYIFKSAKDAEVYGFTSDDTGGNLPEAQPWAIEGGGAAMPGGDVADNEMLIQTLRTEGYYIVHTGRPRWPG